MGDTGDPTTTGPSTDETVVSSRHDGSAAADASNGAGLATAKAEVETLEQEAPLAPEGRRQAALWLRAGELRERVLFDPTGARSAYRNAREAAPDWNAARRACRMAAAGAGDWNEVAELLKEEVKVAADPMDVSAELAEVLVTHLQRDDEALTHVKKVLDRAPSHPHALGLLVKLLTKKKKWEDLAERLSRAAEAANDPARAAALYYEAGQTHRLHRKDMKTASVCFEKALDADSSSIVALKALSEVAAMTSDWPKLARVLEREAQAEAGRELAAAALIHLAQVREDLLDDPKGSAAAYRRALESDPENLYAIQGLARFAEAQANPVDLTRIYEQELALTTDTVQAAALRYVLGELCEGSLQAPERAVNHYKAALEALPDHGPAFRALGQLYARLGEWRELGELFQQEAKQTKDSGYRAHIWYKLAELYEERLSDEEAAIQFNQRVLEDAPDYLPALRALGRLYAKRKDWPSLANLYEGEIGVTEDPKHRALLLTKLAELYDERLANYEKAADCHRKILAIDSGNVTSVRTLARLAFRRGDWEELIQMNMQEIELVTEPRVIAALYQKTGEIFEEHIQDPEKAYGCYRAALQKVPSYLPALRALGRLAANQGDWEEVARTLEAEADQVGDSERAQSLMLGAAEIYEKRLNDAKRAMKTYRKLLEKEPGYPPAVRALARLLRVGSHWADLARLLEDTLPHADDATIPLILQWLAQIQGHRLKKDDQAAELLKKAREDIPDRGAPMRALEEYLARSKRWVELAEIYRQAAELAPSGPYRAALYLRLGDLAKNVADNVEFATSYYRSALEESPGSRAALGRLKRVAQITNDDDTLAQCLANEAQRASDKEERRVLMLELATVHERGGRVAQAADCYAMAAKLGSSAELWARAATLFRKAERFQEAADAYVSAAENTGDDTGERGRNRMAAAEVLERDLNDLGGAATILIEVSAELEDPMPPLLALERVESARGNHEALAAIRRQLADAARDPKRALYYRLLAADTLANTLDRPEEAATELEKVLAMDPSREDAARMLGEIRERLGDIDSSIAAFEAASRAAPNDRSPLLALERLYTQKQAWEPLLTVYNRLITTAPDPEHAAQAFYQKGMVLFEKLNMRDKAQVHFERALEAFGRHAPSLERLFDIHRSAERWKEARDAMERLLALPGYRTVERMVKLGFLLDEGFNDDKGAVAALREAIQIDSKNTEALEALARILERVKDWSGLVAVYQELSQGAPRERLIYLQARLAELYEQHLDRPADAVTAWRQILRDDPQNMEAHEALARIFAKKPETVDQALKAHREILAIDPIRVGSYQALEKHYEEAGKKDPRFYDRKLALLDVIVLLKAANTEQLHFYNDRFRELPRPGHTQQVLSATDLQTVMTHPSARNWTSNFLPALCESIMKSRGVDLSATYGVQKGDRVGAGTQHPLRQRVDAIARLYAVPPVTLYVLNKPGILWHLEWDEGPVLLVSKDVGGLSLSSQDFLIGRALFYVAAGWVPLASTGASQITHEVALAAAAVGAAPAPESDNPREVGRRVKVITKTIPRRRRKEIAQMMTDYNAAPDTFNLGGLVSRASISADRAGLVAGRSIQRAFEVLKRIDQELQHMQLDDPESFAVTASTSPVARELLLFAVSEDYFALRKKLGLGMI